MNLRVVLLIQLYYGSSFIDINHKINIVRHFENEITVPSGYIK